MGDCDEYRIQSLGIIVYTITCTMLITTPGKRAKIQSIDEE